MILYVLLFLLFVLLFVVSQERPDTFFWTFLILFFDPGGFFAGYFANNIVGLINYNDLIFVCILMPAASKSISLRDIKRDRDFRNFLIILMPVFAYYIFIYGIFVPLSNHNLDFISFMTKSRMYFYAIPILLLVYTFAQRNIGLFLNVLTFYAVVVLTLYFITLLTKIPIVPVTSLLRYRTSNILRLGMYSYGLIQYLLPIGVIIFLLRRKYKFELPYKKWIYYAAVLMLITLILTLTRREYLRIVILFIVSLSLISYLFKESKIKIGFKLLYGSAFVLLLLFILFPTYFTFLFRLYKDMFLLFSTGTDTRGVSDYRITGTGDLQIAMEFIRNSPLLGTGYQYFNWANAEFYRKIGDINFIAYDASSEVPIYGIFYRMGVIGFIVATPIYLYLLRQLIRFIKKIKIRIKYLDRSYSIYLLTTIFIFVQLIMKFTSEFYTLYYEFYEPSKMVGFVLIVELFFALKIIILNSLQ